MNGTFGGKAGIDGKPFTFRSVSKRTRRKLFDYWSPLDTWVPGGRAPRGSARKSWRIESISRRKHRPRMDRGPISPGRIAIFHFSTSARVIPSPRYDSRGAARRKNVSLYPDRRKIPTRPGKPSSRRRQTISNRRQRDCICQSGDIVARTNAYRSYGPVSRARPRCIFAHRVFGECVHVDYCLLSRTA